MKMKTELKFVMKYTVASLGSLVALILIWVLTYALSGTTTEFLEPPGNIFWGCRSLLWLPIVFFPLSLAGEFVFVQQLNLPWWIHTPIMVMVFGLTSIILMQMLFFVLVFQLIIVNDPLSTLILSVQDLLWGGTYWILLRGSDRLFERVVRSGTGQTG